MRKRTEPRYDGAADAERRLDHLLEDATFFLRQGCPPAIAASTFREVLVAALTESDDGESIKDLRRDISERDDRIEELEQEIETYETRLDEAKKDFEDDMRVATARIVELQKELHEANDRMNDLETANDRPNGDE